MPNWKKVIISGSDAQLNSITMSGNLIPDSDNVHSLGASDNRFLLNGGTPVTVTGSGTANTLTRFQGATTVEDSKITSTDTQTVIEHDNSGSSIFIVSGANGQMLSISDEVGEKLFTVNNSSGLEVFSVSASGNLLMPNLTYSDTDYILSYASSSGIVRFVSASSVLPDGTLSGSAQIASEISGSLSNTAIAGLGARIASGAGDFVANEFIVAVGKNAITSSDALAVDSSGNLGIGTASPEVRLHMSGDGAQTAQIRMEQFNDTTDAPDIRTRRARGTSAAPADVQAGDYLFRLNVEGRDGGSNVTYGSQQFDVDSSDQDALNYKLETRDTDGTLAQRYMIDGTGNHQFTGSVDVTGSVDITGGDLTVSNITLADKIIHDGDSNTHINLKTDEIVFTAGGTRTVNIESGNLTINDTGADYNFKVESSGNANMIKVDAGTNRVGIGIANPSHELSVTGSVSASAFIGDGSGLTGISSDIVSSSTVSETFTNATTHSVSHTFGTKDVIVNVYDSNDDIFVPTRINTPTTSSVVLYMDPATSGRVVIGKAGHIVSGSSDSVDLSAVDQHIIPATDNTYDLGSSTKQWRDLYLSSGSLYIDGTQIVSSDSNTLTFTTDTGQSIKLLEEGADDIILQTDTGNIELKGTVEILTGKKITDSAGSSVHFGDSISVTGSINVSGNVDGIDLQAFSSSVSTSLASSTADYTELSNVPSGIVSGAAQVSSLLPDGVISGSQTIYSQSFSSVTAVTASHNFGTKDVVVSVYDNSDNLFFPNNVKTATTSSVLIDFNSSRSGRVVVSKGGHLVDGTGVDADTAITASYITASGVDGTVANATTASYALTSSRSENNNTNSGSISFWQGSQSEYDALSSYDSSTVYFVV